MATDKPRFSVTFTDESYAKIQKYKSDHNISTQSKAVAQLVERAIDEIESENCQKKSPSTAEAAPGEDVLSMFDKLNDLLISEGFIKEDEDLTDRQADIILAICRIISAAFQG